MFCVCVFVFCVMCFEYRVLRVDRRVAESTMETKNGGDNNGDVSMFMYLFIIFLDRPFHKVVHNCSP